MQYYHINFIKRAIDVFFTEGGNPKLNKDGRLRMKIINSLNGDKKGFPLYDEIKAVDTTDKDKLAEFADRKLNEYLNPGPVYKEGKKIPSLYLSQISQDNTVKRRFRTPEMFFNLQIKKAIEYQNYFPKYKEDSEHFKYWDRLNDWINHLEVRLKNLLPNQSQTTPDQIPVKEVYIDEKIIPALHEALIPKFYHPNELLKIFNGEKTGTQVQFKYKGKLLCSIFKFLHEKNFIGNPESETKSWLVKYFTITEKRVPKLLKVSTVEDYFKDRQINAPLAELIFLEK